MKHNYYSKSNSRDYNITYMLPGVDDDHIKSDNLSTIILPTWTHEAYVVLHDNIEIQFHAKVGNNLGFSIQNMTFCSDLII